MMGREDLDECPKCHDTGVCFVYARSQDAYTATATWCNCPAVNWTNGRRLVAFERELARNPQLWHDIFDLIPG